MGICISSASSGIHQAEDGFENVAYLQETIAYNGVQKIGSLYSKVGSKGLNQDAASLYHDYGMEGGVFCGVFDGHGKNGHLVSKMVKDRLASLLLRQRDALAKTGVNISRERADGDLHPSETFDQWKRACISAFKVMDKEIKLRESLDCSYSGTTAVVFIKQGEDMIIANLGDSRAVLGAISDDRIIPVQLTTDLKPSLPSEADRIRKCKGRVLALQEQPHIQRVWLPNEDSPGLAMSRAFGDFRLKDYGVIALPRISYHRLTSSDQFLVLATDGVWDVLSNEQVVSIVWAAENKQEAAIAVVEAAVVAWRKKFPSSNVDDCTVVCLFLQNRE
ncbi:hypothetical protein K2173_009895 [Erythroxylum novogranatense]|uniref:PPM-type phosphatase domain-containing protein n=1 Tax=Erythroxylum novogranatense TaxID=1862640 RepID=A0AAV8T0X6_9ROSI|nr:hypothetical protein K2173_009895 [Erythroxylum novogranatense]